jgi:ribonuclease D
VQYEYVADQQELRQFCDDIADAPLIAFDTEFISEDKYRPQLCLIQVAAGERLAVIDPLTIEDLDPFWHVLAAPGHETVVHAGRQEFLFCTQDIGQRPAGWFDVQLAAGFVGLEFPAAYNTLIHRLLGKSLSKGETRTNWHHRPLTRRQIEYAVNDVAFLEPIHDTLCQRIDELQRRPWLEEEIKAWQRQVENADQREPWRRLSGIASLRTSRQLAIARELWRWRESQARKRNSPAKRVLRDDLIVELSRRQTGDLRRIRAIRGLERRNIQRHLAEISQRIDDVLQLDDAACPRKPGNSRSNSPQFTLLGQYLSVALGSICRSAELAPGLVGTVQDLRDLVAFRLGLPGRDTESEPLLAQGWRAEVVGRVVEDLLEGKLALRIDDPLAENPLVLE